MIDSGPEHRVKTVPPTEVVAVLCAGTVGGGDTVVGVVVVVGVAGGGAVAVTHVDDVVRSAGRRRDRDGCRSRRRGGRGALGLRASSVASAWWSANLGPAVGAESLVDPGLRQSSGVMGSDAARDLPDRGERERDRDDDADRPHTAQYETTPHLPILVQDQGSEVQGECKTGANMNRPASGS